VLGWVRQIYIDTTLVSIVLRKIREKSYGWKMVVVYVYEAWAAPEILLTVIVYETSLELVTSMPVAVHTRVLSPYPFAVEEMIETGMAVLPGPDIVTVADPKLADGILKDQRVGTSVLAMYPLGGKAMNAGILEFGVLLKTYNAIALSVLP
jgi:hypothetical protein